MGGHKEELLEDLLLSHGHPDVDGPKDLTEQLHRDMFRLGQPEEFEAQHVRMLRRDLALSEHVDDRGQLIVSQTGQRGDAHHGLRPLRPPLGRHTALQVYRLALAASIDAPDDAFVVV